MDWLVLVLALCLAGLAAFAVGYRNRARSEFRAQLGEVARLHGELAKLQTEQARLDMEAAAIRRQRRSLSR